MTPQAAKQAGGQLVDLDTLCAQADFISLHAPLAESTMGMIGNKQFDLMKQTAILINTSRGPLVETKSLIEALKNDKIACAGIDVFETEPLEAGSELRELENVTLTDHAGWYSIESMTELKTKAAQNIADTLINGQPKYIVNI